MITQTIWQTYLELAHSASRCGDNDFARQMFDAANIEAQKLHVHAAGVTQQVQGLAQLYEEQGRYKEAESLHKKCLTENQQVLGKDHPDLVPILDALADLYVRHNKELHAEPLVKRALGILEMTHGDGAHLTDRLFKLASIWRRQGRIDAAQELFSRAGRLQANF